MGSSSLARAQTWATCFGARSLTHLSAVDEFVPHSLYRCRSRKYWYCLVKSSRMLSEVIFLFLSERMWSRSIARSLLRVIMIICQPRSSCHLVFAFTIGFTCPATCDCSQPPNHPCYYTGFPHSSHVSSLCELDVYLAFSFFSLFLSFRFFNASVLMLPFIFLSFSFFSLGLHANF